MVCDVRAKTIPLLRAFILCGSPKNEQQGVPYPQTMHSRPPPPCGRHTHVEANQQKLVTLRCELINCFDIASQKRIIIVKELGGFVESCYWGMASCPPGDFPAGEGGGSRKSDKGPFGVKIQKRGGFVGGGGRFRGFFVARASRVGEGQPGSALAPHNLAVPNRSFGGKGCHTCTPIEIHSSLA